MCARASQVLLFF